MMDSAKLQKVLERIDAFNERDLHRIWHEGKEYAYEILYANHLTRWVTRLESEASMPLLIAARGQHVGRWTIPRRSYPAGREGYLRWREDLKKFHAGTVEEIMRELDCPEDVIQATRSIILKKDFRSNPDGQTMEDALCLVFLETQFESFKEKTVDEKMRNIIVKTWKKMSPRGRAAAVDLRLNPESRALLTRILKEAHLDRRDTSV